MENNYINEEDKVEWNLSSGITEEIKVLLLRSNNAYLKGSIPKAFYFLKCVKFRFIQNLDTKERKKLKYIEKEFALLFNNNSKSRLEYGLIFENYNEAVMDLLDRYGFLLQKKKDSKRII